MRKIGRSLACPNVWFHRRGCQSLSLSLFLAPTTFFTSKGKRGDRKQRLSDTFIETESGKGYFRVYIRRPSSASYKSTKGANRFQLMHRYGSLVVAEETWKSLEFSYRIVPSPLGFTRRGRENPYHPGEIPSLLHNARRISYELQDTLFLARVIMWKHVRMEKKQRRKAAEVCR